MCWLKGYHLDAIHNSCQVKMLNSQPVFMEELLLKKLLKHMLWSENSILQFSAPVKPRATSPPCQLEGQNTEITKG